MLSDILSITEFATKLVAGLSGAVFAIAILLIAVHSKNKVKPEDSPAETRRRAKKQNEQVLQAEQDKKNKRKKNKTEVVEDNEQVDDEEDIDEDEADEEE